VVKLAKSRTVLQNFLLALGVVVLILAIRALYVLGSIPFFKRSWDNGNAKAASSKQIVLVALGDSTAQGIGALTPSQSFVSRVAKRISEQQKKPVKIYNFSTSGVESGDILKNQLPKLKKLPRYDAVMIATGPNNITHKKTLKDFSSDIASTLSQLPADKTVISNLPPMGPKDSLGNTSYDWGRAVMVVAQQKNVRVAPVYEHVQTRVSDPRTYAGDFYHPSGAGYKLWADAFTPEVEKILSN
jgi:acyl-CoA thioesterase I